MPPRKPSRSWSGVSSERGLSFPGRDSLTSCDTRLVKHDAHGYWLEEAPAVELAPELVGERSVDVVVVGGGYTGMWAAWHVKQLEPEASGGFARG